MDKRRLFQILLAWVVSPLLVVNAQNTETTEDKNYPPFWQTLHAVMAEQENLNKDADSRAPVKYFILMRHAIAPEVEGFDEENPDLADCSTQRNLSQEGRDQSAFIGDLFRKNKTDLSALKLYSSQYCRAVDTGKYMDLGEITEVPLLNIEETELQPFLQFLQTTDDTSVPFLITHKPNIRLLTGGINTHSAEMLLMQWNKNSGEIQIISSLISNDF